MLKGNILILLYEGSLRGACRVVGNERCARELSFGSEMETEAAVPTTAISVTMQDLHSSSPGWELSSGV